MSILTIISREFQNYFSATGDIPKQIMVDPSTYVEILAANGNFNSFHGMDVISNIYIPQGHMYFLPNNFGVINEPLDSLHTRLDKLPYPLSQPELVLEFS